MSERFTRRALLIGSTGALVGCAGGGGHRERTLTGARIGRQAGVVGVAFLRDGAFAVAADTTAEGTINIWDLNARRIKRSFRVGGRLSRFTLDEGRGLLAAAWRAEAGRFHVGFFDFATGRQVRQIRNGPISGVHCLLVAREGLLTSLEDRAIPMESVLWSFETGRELARFGRPTEAIAADRRTVLGGTEIWDLVSGHPRGELKIGERVWGLAISPDGGRAVSELALSGILWNERGELVRRLDDQHGPIARAGFSPDDRFLITARYSATFRGDRRLLVLRDARTGRSLADLPGHEKFVSGIAFSPDGASALSAGLNGELILWTMPR